MNPCLGGIAVQSPAVGIAGQAVHDGKANRAGRIALQAEVIVSSCNGMVMLVHNKVMSSVVEVPPVDC